jgi:hypothetical protein
MNLETKKLGWREHIATNLNSGNDRQRKSVLISQMEQRWLVAIGCQDFFFFGWEERGLGFDFWALYLQTDTLLLESHFQSILLWLFGDRSHELFSQTGLKSHSS